MALLERDWVLESLSTLAADASVGRGSMVFIAGEAGAGKTSVIRAFLNHHPTPALIGACDSIPTPGQLWPLRDLAERASPALREPVLAQSDRETLFRAALAELSARSGETVMVIEDIHWADDATLDLLRFLGRRVADTRGLVIATYRDDDAAQLHRLRLVLGDLATIPSLHRITLPPLSRDAVAHLARGRADDVDTLYARTGGNAFFVSEMLAAGSHLPDSIGDAIRARYARLTPPARTVLDLAAVMGESMEMSELQAIAGEQRHALIDTIESGALILEGRTIRFRHALVRDAVLSALSPIARMELYGRVFDTAQERTASIDPATMAHFAEEAGRFDAVAVYAKAAAQRAASLRSYREAAVQYQRAIRYSTGWELAERSELLGQLASATYYCGSGETDIDVLRGVVTSCRSDGDEPRLVDHLISLAWLLNDEGMLEESAACADEAVIRADELGDPALRAAALCALADIRYQAGDSAAALEMDAVALELALATGRSRTAVHAGITMGSALLASDRPAGIALLDECVERARREHFDGEVAHALGILGFHSIDMFELQQGREILQEMLDFTAEHDLDCWWRWAAIGMAKLMVTTGEWAHASDFATRATRIQSGCFLNRLYGHLTIARIRARRGDPDVGEAIEDAIASCSGASFPSIACAIDLMRAEAAYLAGDDRLADEIAQPALAMAIRYHMPWVAGPLAHLVLRAGGALSSDYEPIGPYRFERTGCWVDAHAAWQALGAPYEAACALSMAGDENALREAFAAFERLGARPMAGRVTRNLRELGIASVPRGPRTATKAHPFGLTAREAEVLALLAEGCTNGEIAERLYLSGRTVEHHVSAILTKLDVKTRREAVRAALSVMGEPVAVAGS
jgi:DNA-binding CsgD family transcriptional regulator/tetratricopeptide (TPR) repeat protein